MSFEAQVLSRYEVKYFYCETCGFLQTEKPYWLVEAYRDAIAEEDTGLVARNFQIADTLIAYLYLLFGRNGRYLDVAGGIGLLTRLMRDAGFDYYWSDTYSVNVLARGFEATPEEKFTAVSAFEVLEHVYEPFDFLAECMEHSEAGTVVFSTVLFDKEVPGKDWWYYSFDSGQHISFYQARTLKALAKRLDANLYTRGTFHVLSKKRLNGIKVFLLQNALTRRLLTRLLRGWLRSKTLQDHDELRRRKLTANRVEEK